MSPDATPGRDPAALAALVLPALATAVAVAFAATGAGLLLPEAAVSDGAALGIRIGGVALALVGMLPLVSRWGRAARVARRDLAAVLLAAAVAMAGVTTVTFAFSSATLDLPESDPVATTTTERAEVDVERHGLERAGIPTALMAGDDVAPAISALRRVVARRSGATAGAAR